MQILLQIMKRLSPYVSAIAMTFTMGKPLTAYAQPDLSSLVQILRTAPEGGWVKVNLNRFADVYTPTDLQPGPYIGNTSALIRAWSSFAWDSNRGDLILFGGGHANYADNEVYRWRGGSQVWERASLPSQLVNIGADSITFETIDGAANAPVSSHTYDNQLFLPRADRFITFGGAAYNSGGPFVTALVGGGVRATGPYFWDPALADPNKVGGTTGSHVNPALHPNILGGQMWENRDIYSGRYSASILPGSFINSVSDYASENSFDTVYISGHYGSASRADLFRYQVLDPLNRNLDTWEQVGLDWTGISQGQGTGAYDPLRKLFVRTGNATAQFSYWNLQTPGPNNRDVAVTSVTDATGLFQINANFGVDFDPIRRVFVLWGGGGQVWFLTPPTVLGPTGWSIALQPVPVGAVPSPDVGTGVLGKFKYIPNLGAFMALQDPIEGQIWLYKPMGWAAPPGNISPTIILSSPATGTTFGAPAQVTLSANATDVDGVVTSVEFRRNGTLIASKAVAPYTYIDQNVAAGIYVYSAKAYDNAGDAALSANSTVTVLPVGSAKVVLQDAVGGYSGTLDTYLDSYNPTYTGWGGGVNLLSYFSNQYSTLVRFSIFQSEGGPVPNGATITSATLSLYKSSFGDRVFEARRVLRDWKENQASWSTALTGIAWSVGGANGIGTDLAAASDGLASVGWDPAWADFNVTTGVQSMSQGGGNYGWSIIPVSGLAAIQIFNSRESATASSRPKLVITYSTNGAVNVPPTVSLTSPTVGASFSAPASVVVSANAQDSDGSVTSVEFYRNGTLISTKTAAPYTYTDSGVGAGNYSYLAKAFDNSGAATSSAATSVTVNAPINVPPTVSLTSPTVGASFAAPANVVVSANAQDSDGSVTSVEFYRNGTLISTKTAAPFTYTDSGVATGSYAYTAKAHDNAGAVTTSSAATITVQAAGSGTATLQDATGGYAGTQDTYLDSYNPNYTGWGNSAVILNYIPQQYGSLVRFAIYQSEGGPVPDGATITSAILSVYKSSAYDQVYQVKRVLLDWTEGQASWNSARTGLAWSVPGARGAGTDVAVTADASASVGWDPAWVDFNVTTSVKSMSTGGNYGWSVVPVSGTSALKAFNSSENTSATLRPKLVITYTP